MAQGYNTKMEVEGRLRLKISLGLTNPALRASTGETALCVCVCACACVCVCQQSCLIPELWRVEKVRMNPTPGEESCPLPPDSTSCW